MKNLTLSILAAVLFSLSLGTFAERPCCQGDPQQMLEHMAERLNLTEEQKTAMRPVLESSAKQRMAVLEAHGIQPGTGKPAASQMKGMRGEMRAIREDTDKQLATILDDEQMAELQQMRAEMREQMKQQRKQQQQQQQQQQQTTN